jgi:hypothetical protein
VRLGQHHQKCGRGLRPLPPDRTTGPVTAGSSGLNGDHRSTSGCSRLMIPPPLMAPTGGLKRGNAPIAGKGTEIVPLSSSLQHHLV